MKRSICVLAALAAIAAAPGAASAGQITITQFASSAPNAFGSPSWAGYVANAMDSLQHTPGSAEGTAGTPTYYSTLGGTFTAGDAMATSFHSWRGQANPSTPFEGEYGNRIHFGVAITDTGSTFNLADVSFTFHSSDVAGNFIDGFTCPSGAGGSLCWENNLAGTSFSSYRIGINFGTDGVLGGGNDTIYDTSSSGDDHTPINALFYVGDGNAEWPGGPGDPLTGQAALDAMTSYIDSNIASISNEYCVQRTCTTSTLRNVDFVPEPGTIALLGSGLLCLVAFRRRRISPFSTAAG